MDQLFEAFGLNGQLLIAQAVNFGVLLVALYFLLYKPVLKTLDERAKKVAQGVEDAQQAAEKLANADGEAATIVSKATKRLRKSSQARARPRMRKRTRLVKDAEARAVAIAADADARAKEASAKLLRESEKEIARLAVLAAGKAMAKD